MEAADWTEMAQMAGSNTIGCFGILLTLMSGYLVVAYLVGEKLTRVQIAIVNSLYVISSLSVAVSHRQCIIDVIEARSQAHFADPNSFAAVDPSLMGWIPTVFAMINIGLMLASLYFMWSIRHPKIE